MENQWKDLELINNDSDTKKKFEIHINGDIAYMDYMVSKQGIIYLTHTEVPQNLEGQGVGSTLVSKVLDFIKNSDLKMAPLCPFVAAYLKRHPERADGILARGYSIS
ncbi:MAG: GNAT family N-acetyltransferase [Bacteroidota bacterium]